MNTEKWPFGLRVNICNRLLALLFTFLISTALSFAETGSDTTTTQAPTSTAEPKEEATTATTNVEPEAKETPTEEASTDSAPAAEVTNAPTDAVEATTSEATETTPVTAPEVADQKQAEQEATPANETPKKLQKFEVTGTLIKRVEIEGPSPVLVIDREAIEISGASTLSQFLRNLTFNNGGYFNENQTQATTTSPGSSGINFRGLGQDATLILLNGRRVANYSFAHNTTDTFVDLNSIPLGAIERIEVQKDGASATYGSDALAGVVNIILRKDMDNSEITLEHGVSSKHDADENHLNFATGVSNDSSNITFIFDVFKREPFLLGDRSFSESALQSGAIDPNGAGYDYTQFDNHPANGVSFSQPPDPACFGLSFCSGFFDPNPYMTAVPKTKRTTGLVSFNKELATNLSMFSEISINQVITELQWAPSSLYAFDDNVVFPGTHVNNPYPGEDLYLFWRITDLGPRKDTIETNNHRAVAGLEGTINNIDWDFALNYSRSDSQLTGENYVSRLALIDAFNNDMLDPFGTSSASDLDSIRATISRKGVSVLQAATGKINTEVGELSGGPVVVAVGLERRYERMEDTPDAITARGEILGQGSTTSSGDRDLSALYGEVNLPVRDNVEIQLSARIENYSDFGTTANPKLAVRYQPTSTVLFRASWGTGFRAPSLPELYQADTIVRQDLIDTSRCAEVGIDCGVSPYSTNRGSNDNLDPEESESIYLGAVFEPLADLSIGLDYWRYNQTDVVDSNAQFILDHECEFPTRVDRGGTSPCPGQPGYVGAGNDPGAILSIEDQFFNIAEQNTDGIDLDISYSWKTATAGKFNIHSLITRVLGIERKPYPGESFDDLLGTFHYPKLRAQLTLGWSKLAYSASITANHIDKYEDQFYGRDLYGDGNISGSRDLHMIDSYTSFDAQFTYTGLANSKITFGIRNLTDEEPPLSNANTVSYDFATHDPTGRFYYARYNYQF